jgi:hypothetical protein
LASGKELRIAGSLILAEQAAEAADGDLEIFDVDILIEGKVLIDVLLDFGGFFVEAHQQHGVETIDLAHVQRDAVPVVRLFGERHKGVVAPGVCVVALPGVEIFGADASGHGIAVGGGAKCGGRLCEQRDRHAQEC